MRKPKITKIQEMPEYIRLSDIASPLVSMPHSHRVTLFRNKKENGTTIPYFLFAAFKASILMESSGEDDILQEPMNLSIEKSAQLTLRQILNDIHRQADALDVKIMVGRTLQEKIFNHLVYDEALMPIQGSDLVEIEKENYSHTISGAKIPSFTLPTYLCQWVFRKDGICPNTDIRHANAFLKRVAIEVYDEVKGHGDKKIRASGGFSRRVQNRLFLMAIEESDNVDMLGALLRNRFRPK